VAPDGVRAAVKTLFKDMFDNRTVVILLVVFIVAVIEAGYNSSPEWNALAAASGGALVGLLGPSPAAK
jgi:cytochrome c oxidase assembly protein Cox11